MRLKSAAVTMRGRPTGFFFIARFFLKTCLDMVSQERPNRARIFFNPNPCLCNFCIVSSSTRDTCVYLVMAGRVGTRVAHNGSCECWQLVEHTKRLKYHLMHGPPIANRTHLPPHESYKPGQYME